VSTSVHCSRTLVVLSQLHYSFHKIHPSLWFLFFLIHQAIPKFIGDFRGDTVCSWTERIFLFFLHLFIPNFIFWMSRVLPRKGIVESHIRILLPRSSVKDLRASENHPTYGDHAHCFKNLSTSIKDRNFSWRGTKMYWLL